MKYRITKAEFDALSDALKVLYVAEGDGYKLPLTDMPDDPGELRRARDREKADAKVAKDALALANAELETLKLKPARESNDIKTLEASWKAKHDEMESRLTGLVDKGKKRFEKMLLDTEANKFAASLAAKPENIGLILPHVVQRLEVVYDGEEATVRIKDKTGRVSAMNFDELKKEYVETPMFGSIVVGTKASGAGGGRQQNGTPGGGAVTKFMDMPEADRVALFKSDPVEYRRRKLAEGQ